MKNELLVCTANFAADPSQLRMLQESCSFYGLDFDWYGQDEQWEGSLKSKLHGMIDYLKTVKHKYILFMDGWDSWMLADKKTIMRKYRKFNKKTVISGHTDCYPYKEYTNKLPKVDTRFRYICSGCFIGERKDLLNNLKIIRDGYGGWSDQGAWTMAYADGTIDIEIDHNCELFITMSFTDLSETLYRKDKFYLKETKTYPIGIHFGGPKGGSPNGLAMEKAYNSWLINRSYEKI